MWHLNIGDLPVCPGLEVKYRVRRVSCHLSQKLPDALCLGLEGDIFYEGGVEINGVECFETSGVLQ